MQRHALVLALLFASAAPDLLHAQFRHETAGLEITPPDYMLAQWRDVLAPESLIACWYAPETAEYTWVRMCAETLDRLPKADEKLTFQWNGRAVSGSRTLVRTKAAELMQHSVLVPLRQGTIRIDVVTPVHGAEEGRATLEETLATIKDVGLATAMREPEVRYSDRTDVRISRYVGQVGTFLLILGITKWVRERRARRKEETEGNGASSAG